LKGSKNAKGEQEHYDALDRLRVLAVAATEAEDFAHAAREAERLLDAAAVSAFACPEDDDAAARVEQLSLVHRMLVRATGLAVLRRGLGDAAPET